MTKRRISDRRFKTSKSAKERCSVQKRQKKQLKSQNSKAKRIERNNGAVAQRTENVRELQTDR